MALKIGQKVFRINHNLEIIEKKIVAIVKAEKEVKYQLNTDSCVGLIETDFFLTKSKAEAARQDFLDKLKFKVGDLIIFKMKDWSQIVTRIGRIDEINYSKRPY